MQTTSCQNFHSLSKNISTDGILTTLRHQISRNYEPIFDATAVANTKAKDMIVISKTNMDGVLPWVDLVKLHLWTNQNWDRSKVPGGSSSGSAAAKLDHLSLVQIQVVLSVSRLHNRIVGLKPTYGTDFPFWSHCFLVARLR